MTIVGAGVSRRHAVIRYRGGRYELRELNSTNGTFVNNKRVVTSTLLSDGDEIRFGAARFAFLDHKETKTSAVARRASGHRFGLRAAIEMLVILFMLGFAAAEYLIDHHYFNWPRERISPGNSSSTATFATRVAQGIGAASHETVAPGARLAATSAAQPDWLARLNYYRAMAKLPAVVEDPRLSSGDFKHARYLVENYSSLIQSGGELGAAMHNEERTNSWYSAEGIAAARNSDVFEGCGSSSPARHVDGG